MGASEASICQQTQGLEHEHELRLKAALNKNRQSDPSG